LGEDRASNTEIASAPLESESSQGADRSATPVAHPKKGKKNKSEKETAGTSASYQEFRRTCDNILVQVNELRQLVGPGDGLDLADGWEGPAVEIRSLLLILRGVKWGQSDSLKRWVTAVIFQVSNVKLDARHVGFLYEATRALRIRYAVDSSAVDECVEILKRHGLDPFRGVTSMTDVATRYKVVKE
jgi:hypothetical protein